MCKQLIGPDGYNVLWLDIADLCHSTADLGGLAFSVAWSIAFRTQGLYTQPHVLKKRRILCLLLLTCFTDPFKYFVNKFDILIELNVFSHFFKSTAIFVNLIKKL